MRPVLSFIVIALVAFVFVESRYLPSARSRRDAVPSSVGREYRRAMTRYLAADRSRDERHSRRTIHRTRRDTCNDNCREYFENSDFGTCSNGIGRVLSNDPSSDVDTKQYCETMGCTPLLNKAFKCINDYCSGDQGGVRSTLYPKPIVTHVISYTL